MTNDLTAGQRKYFHGNGVDSVLRELLGRMADEVAGRTKIAIAVPTKEILAIFHQVYATVPNIPDYDAEGAESRRWSTQVQYASDEIPDAAFEVGAYMIDGEEDPVVQVVAEAPDADIRVNLDPQHAEAFFLAGLAAAREAGRRRAERPVLGISDEVASAALAERGIVIETPDHRQD